MRDWGWECMKGEWEFMEWWKGRNWLETVESVTNMAQFGVVREVVLCLGTIKRAELVGKVVKCDGKMLGGRRGNGGDGRLVRNYGNL